MRELRERARSILATMDQNALKEKGYYYLPSNYSFTAHYPSVKALIPHQRSEHMPLAPTGLVDLYIHFPLCSGKCSFCHFNIKSSTRRDETVTYLHGLQKELETLAPFYSSVTVRNIYFGGGTPSLMSSGDVAQVYETIRKNYRMESRSLVTFELHPEFRELWGTSYLTELKSLGINRVSIGVQDFNDEVLRLNYRRHDSDSVRESIALARASGLMIGIDLLAPLTGQDSSKWSKTLEEAFSLKTDSVTLYTTSIKKSMPIYQDQARIPSAEETVLMYLMTQEAARDFGRRETASRWFVPDNVGMEKMERIRDEKPQVPTIGFGAGAYGGWKNFHYYNLHEVSDYLGAIERNETPWWRSLAMSKEEAFCEEVVLSARTGRIAKKRLSGHEFSFENKFTRQISEITSLGLGEWNDEGLVLNRFGKIFSDEIARSFVSEEVRMRSLAPVAGPNELGTLNHLNHFYEL